MPTATTPFQYSSIEAARTAGNGYFKSGDLDAAVAAYTQGMLDLYPASLVACSIPGVVHCEKQLGLISKEDVSLLYNNNNNNNDAAVMASSLLHGSEGGSTMPERSAVTTPPHASSQGGILAPSSLLQSTSSTPAMRPLELLEEFNKCCGNACMSLYKKSNHIRSVLSEAATTILTANTTASYAMLQEQIAGASKLLLEVKEEEDVTGSASSATILKSMSNLMDTHHPGKTMSTTTTTTNTPTPLLSVFIEELVVITTSIVQLGLHQQQDNISHSLCSSSSSSLLANILLHLICDVLHIHTIGHDNQEEKEAGKKFNSVDAVTARVDCVQLAATGVLENPFLAKAHAFLGAAAGEVLALTASVLVLLQFPIPTNPTPTASIAMKGALMAQVVEPVLSRLFRNLFNLPAVFVEDTTTKADQKDRSDVLCLLSQISSSSSQLLRLLLQGHFVRALNIANQHLSIAMTLLPELVVPPTPTPTPTSTSSASTLTNVVPVDAGDVFGSYLSPFDAQGGGGVSSSSSLSPHQHFPYTGSVAKGMLVIRLASTLCHLASSSSSSSSSHIPSVLEGGASGNRLDGEGEEGKGRGPHTTTSSMATTTTTTITTIEPPFVIPGLVSSSLHSLSGNGVVFSPPSSSSITCSTSTTTTMSSSLCTAVLPAGQVVAELVYPDSIASYLDPDVVLELDKVTAEDERLGTTLCQCCGISLSDAVIRTKNAGLHASSSTTSENGDGDKNTIWGCMACRMVAFCSTSCVAKYSTTTATCSSASSSPPPATDRHTLFECARYRKLREMFRQITEGNDRFAQGAGGRQTDVPENFLDVAAHTISTLSAIEAEAEEEKRIHTENNKPLNSEGVHRKKRKLLEALEGHDAEVAQSTLPLVPLICQLLNASRGGDTNSTSSSSSFPVSEGTIAHIVGVVLCNSMEVLNEEEEQEKIEQQQHHETTYATASTTNDNTNSAITMPPFLRPLRRLTKSMFDNPDAFGGKGIACGQVLFLNALSHLNHSCRPNCATTTTTTTATTSSPNGASSSSSSSFTIVKKCVQTLRPIFPGEELTISYIPTLYASPKRRSELLTERFYFTCKCPACSGSTTSSSLKNIGSSSNSTTTAELTRGGISWSHVFAAAAISQENSKKKRLIQQHQALSPPTTTTPATSATSSITLSPVGDATSSSTTTTQATSSNSSSSTSGNVAVGTLLARLVEMSSTASLPSTLLELLLSSSSSSSSPLYAHGEHQDLLLMILKALTSTAASTLPPLPTTSQTARLKKSHEVARQDTVSVSYIVGAWAAAQTSTATTLEISDVYEGERGPAAPSIFSSHFFITNEITNKYYFQTDLYQALSSAEKPPANTGNQHRPPGERTNLYFNRAQVLCSGIRERSVQDILEDPTFFKNSSTTTKKSVIHTIIPPGMRTILVELNSFRSELDRHLHPYNHAVQDVRNTTTFALSVLSSHVLSLARREIVEVIAKARLLPPSSTTTSTPTTTNTSATDILAGSNVAVYVAAACLVTTSAVLSTLNELLLWSCLTPDDTFPVKLDKRQNVVHAQGEITQLLMEVDVMCKELDDATPATASSSSNGCKSVIATLLQSDTTINQTLTEVRKAVGSSRGDEEDVLRDNNNGSCSSSGGGNQQLPSLALMRWLLPSSS